MTKVICETTGAFQLVDYGNEGHVVPAFRPSVATLTAFLSARAAAGQLRVIANVSDEATDEEFQAYLKDSEDVSLAIAAFTEAYSVESRAAPAPKPAPASKPARNAKAS